MRATSRLRGAILPFGREVQVNGISLEKYRRTSSGLGETGSSFTRSSRYLHLRVQSSIYRQIWLGITRRLSSASHRQNGAFTAFTDFRVGKISRSSGQQRY